MSKSAILFVTGRAAFLDLFKPDDEYGKYGCQIIMEPDSKSAREVNATVEALGKASKFNMEKLRAAEKLCVKPGDDFPYDSHHGKVVLRAGNSKRPHIVNKDLSPLSEEEGVIYPGCQCVFKVQLWAQDNKWGQRINATLMAVQFSKDDEPYGAGGNSLDGLEAIQDDAEMPF